MKDITSVNEEFTEEDWRQGMSLIGATYSDDVQIYDPLIFDEPDKVTRDSNGIMDDMEGEE